MARQPNTTRSGYSFDTATINAVWAKATIVPGRDGNELRKDSCGAWIRRNAYGQTTDNGWEIDHVKPAALGGGDELSNLQPLQWSNNRHKSDNYPNWSCNVSAVK
jgi:hypothetical protein